MRKASHLLLFFILYLCFDGALFSIQKPPHINEDIWNQITPYTMTETHPAKKELDLIFSERASRNSKSLKKAGFSHTKRNMHSKTIVTKHPKIKGYILKIITDSQIDIVAWKMCLRRIQGALVAQDTINTLGYQSHFTVPKKWIYLIPPLEPYTHDQKICLLVAEDMKLISQRENFEKWRSRDLSKKLLKEFYDIVTLGGLADSTYPFNSPFTKNNKIAFIDTEYAKVWPVKYHCLSMYLTQYLQKYWIKLVKSTSEQKNLS